MDYSNGGNGSGRYGIDTSGGARSGPTERWAEGTARWSDEEDGNVEQARDVGRGRLWLLISPIWSSVSARPRLFSIAKKLGEGEGEDGGGVGCGGEGDTSQRRKNVSTDSTHF